MAKKGSQRRLSWAEKVFPFLLIVSLFSGICSYWYGFNAGEGNEKTRQMERIVHFLSSDQVRADARSYCQRRIAFLNGRNDPASAEEMLQLEKDILSIDQGNVFCLPGKDGISWNRLLNEARTWNTK